MTYKDSMTSKERMLAVLTRQKPDRIPTFYRATEEADHKLMEYTGCEDHQELFSKLHIDRIVRISPRYIGPLIDAGKDIWGITYKMVDYGTGAYRECASHPLAEYKSIDEIEANYTWPSADWYDYSCISELVKEEEEYPISAGGWEPFLRYKYLRGDAQAFMDLILNPEIVHYCLDKMLEYHYKLTQRILEEAGGKVLLSSSSEDLGSQTGLLYSPEQIREFFLPRHKKMIDMMHMAGCYVSWHSDGAIFDIIPDLIAVGVDILDPIQWRCTGMERERLVREFGDQLIFHGGMDNQYTLPFGSIVEVEQEVIDNIKILGSKGGYVLGPCHNIQSVGPPENVVAMYEAAYRYGRVL